MRRLLLLACLIGPASVYSQPKADWKPSTESALQIAKRADKVMSGLKMKEGESLLRILFRAAEGYSKSTLYIESPTRFDIQYTDLLTDAPISGVVRADGVNRAFRDNEAGSGKAQWKHLEKSSRPFSLEGPALAKVFATQFPRLIYAPITVKKPGISGFVAEAIKGAEGFQVHVLTRKIVFNGRTFASDKIVCATSSQAAKKLGYQSVEITVDRQFGVPITVISEVRPLKGGRDSITKLQWTCRWGPMSKVDLKRCVIPTVVH